jgi:hypothetical protein
MMGKILVSQVFAIPVAWACTAALSQVAGNIPWFVPVGIWGFVSLFILAKL